MMWLQLLIGTVALVVTLRCAYVLVARSIGTYIERRHRAIEHILHTQRPPPAWLGRKGIHSEKNKASCLVRLDRLQHYASQSALVADESTRAQLLEQLKIIKAEWVAADWTCFSSSRISRSFAEGRPRSTPRTD